MKFHTSIRKKKGVTVSGIDEILELLGKEYRPEMFLLDTTTFPSWVHQLYEENKLGVVFYTD